MFFKVYSIITQIVPFVKRPKENYFHKIYKQMFLFCLTIGEFVCYNAKYIKQNARIGERNERSSLFPLPYAVCGCSANMALTDLIGWRRIGRRGGILQNKKRYPSKLRPPGAASRFSCSGKQVALPRLATTGYKE